MTHSLFDPTGDDMLEEGDRFTTPSARNNTHMPASAVDGQVGDEPDVKVPLIGDAAEQPLDAKDTEALSEAAREAVEADLTDPNWSTNPPASEASELL